MESSGAISPKVLQELVLCVCGVIPRLALGYVFMTSDLEGSINLAHS